MRKALTIGIISVLILAIAAGAAYTLWARAESAHATDGAQKAPVEEVKSEGLGKDAGAGGDGGQTREQFAKCAGPLPERSRVQVTKLPEGKLGEWVSLRNKNGNVAMRVRVDLETVAFTGVSHHKNGATSPNVGAIFRISVENRSCDDLVWPLRGGLWLSWRQPHPKDITHAWITSVNTIPGDGIWVMENGKFSGKDADLVQKYILSGRFNRTSLKELPRKIAPGQSGEGEILIFVPDVTRKGGLTAPVGLYGDGRLHLALGGEYSWALIDLGRAEDWFRRFVGDPNAPEYTG